MLGSGFIAIACNTVHLFIGEIRQAVGIPVLSVMEETARVLAADKVKSIGLLASETTRNFGLYEKPLSDKGISIVYPENQEAVTRAILCVMGNKLSGEDKRGLVSIVDGLKEKGAEAAVLGCTELPLAISQKDSALPLYDTLQILAEASVKKSIS